jgi:hypothetical protein
MFVDDALHGCQADAIARELGFRVETLKRLKQTAGTGRIKASSIIAHKIHMKAATLLGAKLDSRLRMARCVLPGVAQQIF